MNWPTNRINPDHTPGTRGNGGRRPMPRNGNVIPQNRQAAANRTPVNRSSQSGSVNNLNSYGVTRPASSLTEGQIIKGEVTDLRNNAVVVTLENNTTVTAHIEDNSQLAIGETAAFRVSSISANGIVLTPLPKKDVTLQMSTIQKALEAADLPKNERNIELVHTLMENQLPISKDMILKMLQLTGQHKDASMETVIFMNKYQIPITQESTAQFERYKNQEHQFILEVNRLCDSLPKLLETLSHSNAHPDFPLIGSKILHILFDTDSTAHIFHENSQFSSGNKNSEYSALEAVNSGYPASEAANSEIFGSETSDQQENSPTETSGGIATPDSILSHQNAPGTSTKVLPAVFSTPEAASELLDILENASLTEELSDSFKESVLSGTASLNDVIRVLEKTLYHSITVDNQNLQNLGIPGRLDLTPSGEIMYIQLPPVSKQNLTKGSTESIPTQNTQKTVADTSQPAIQADTTSGKHNNPLQNFFSFFQSKPENDAKPNGTTSFSQTQLLETTDKELFFQTISNGKSDSFSQPLLCTDIFDNPIIYDLWKQYHALQQNDTTLNNQFTLTQRYHLYELLREFPLNDTVKDNLLSGHITSNTLLQNLKEALPYSTPEQVKELFQDETFQKIIKNELLDNFTLTPKDLKNKFKMNTHFDKIYAQLDELETTIRNSITSKNTDPAAQITNQAPGQMEEQLLHQMKSNLDFMKTLNEMFSYMQLPLHLENQTAHGELYVYTKKETLKEHPNSIKVLLHLDLEHLKSVDMHITLDHNRVDSKFYFSDESAEKLIKANLDLLTTALAEKGYIAHTEILKMEKPANVITDFIKNDSSTSSAIKRFSFDIRA